MRYVAIPWDALQVAHTREEQVAVWDLWTYADEQGGRPFAFASRWAQARWSMSARAVEGLLARLVEAGLVVVESPGTPLKPRLISVVNPARQAERTPERTPEHSTAPQTGVLEPERNAPRNAPRNASKINFQPTTINTSSSEVGESEGEEEHPPPSAPPAEPTPAPADAGPSPAAAGAVTPKRGRKAQTLTAVQAVWDEWRKITPARKATPSVGEARAITARLDKDQATVDDVVTVLRWAALADEPYPRQVRGELPWPSGDTARHLSIETLCKAERWAKRLADAQAWASSSAATPTAPEPWAAPFRGSPDRTGSPELAAEWIRGNGPEVAAVQQQIRLAGGGWPQLRQWLSPRVTDPDQVVRALRVERLQEAAK